MNRFFSILLLFAALVFLGSGLYTLATNEILVMASPVHGVRATIAGIVLTLVGLVILGYTIANWKYRG